MPQVALRSSARRPSSRQPIADCLEHLIALIRRVVTANYSENPDRFLEPGPISRSVLDKFVRRRKGDAGCLTPLALPRTSQTCGGAVRAAMEKVEESIFKTLRGVGAFGCLSDKEVRKLQATLSTAKFADGEYVFEQGAEGDVFYLITGGEAEVLHYDPSDKKKEETLLNILSISAYFGEAALIKRAPRNASIMAKGDLHVAYISRDAFETALGRSLADMHLAADKQQVKRT